MKSMLHMSLFWKIHNDYKKSQCNYEKKCKSQFMEYLKYLETKNIKITDYVSFVDTLI